MILAGDLLALDVAVLGLNHTLHNPLDCGSVRADVTQLV